jgi:DNA-binding NarL/FixJ family response regulator
MKAERPRRDAKISHTQTSTKEEVLNPSTNHKMSGPEFNEPVQAVRVTMRQHQSFAIILVGKSILLREGLARILRSANFRILASVSCADDLPPNKLQLDEPLFLVVHTGDDFGAAVEQIELFRDQHPGRRIAIVADHYRLGDLVSAFRAGANGYFVDVIACDVFIKSIELVMLGETILPPAFLSLVLDPEGDPLGETAPRDENNQAIRIGTENTLAPQLSTREKSILRLLIEGDSNKSIARKIDIAEATVKVHVKAILRKIRVQNRTQAAIWGVNNGSVTRLENNSSPPSTSDLSKRLVEPVEVISKIRQIGPPVPPGAIGHDANHVDVSSIDRLIRTGIDRRTDGAARPRKTVGD